MHLILVNSLVFVDIVNRPSHIDKHVEAFTNLDFELIDIETLITFSKHPNDQYIENERLFPKTYEEPTVTVKILHPGVFDQLDRRTVLITGFYPCDEKLCRCDAAVTCKGTPNFIFNLIIKLLINSCMLNGIAAGMHIENEAREAANQNAQLS